MFYTPIQISQNKGKTPEGFLICYGCAIARTGIQLYSDMEVNCEAGDDGMVRVERSETEVFSPETLMSGEGKDIVIDHPSEDVLPSNWRALSHGHMQNLRRGTGVEDHLLLADLVFKSPEAIALIEQNPHSQLSCGYDARYKIHGPGHAEQTEIRINHCAIVDAARCGPTCSTRDSAASTTVDLWGQTDLKNSCTLSSRCSQEDCNCGETQRTGVRMAKWIDRMMAAFSAKDEKAFTAAVRDAEEQLEGKGKDEHHIHVHLGSAHETKPEGGLPSTGEKEVTSAKDDKLGSGGEPAATFGGHTFFSDAATNSLFHGEMKKMGDSLMGLHGEMGQMRDTVEGIGKQLMEHFKAKDNVPGEESAHEEPNKHILGELKEEAPDNSTGDLSKARDSAFLGDSFGKTCQDAEILVPGISVPTFDAAAAPADGYKVICGLRRKALLVYGATKDGEKALSEVTQVRDFAGCSCKEITGAFRAAVALQKSKNSDMNIRGFKDGDKTATSERPAPITLASWQKAIDDYNAANGVRAD